MNPEIIFLNGKWEFFYSPLKFDPARPLPKAKEYTGKMMVPGYWDDHYELFDEEDFFGLTARFNPDYRKPHFPMGRSLTPHAASSFLIGTGYCRKVFVPQFETGSQTVLTVGPAMWGCFVRNSSRTTPSYYGLKAFGEIVRYPVRLEAESSQKNVTVLAGENETGAKALLISAFKTGNLEYELKADIPLSPANCRIHLLDNEHRLALVEDAVFSGNTVKFESVSNSACVLVNIG